MFNLTETQNKILDEALSNKGSFTLTLKNKETGLSVITQISKGYFQKDFGKGIGRGAVERLLKGAYNKERQYGRRTTEN